MHILFNLITVAIIFYLFAVGCESIEKPYLNNLLGQHLARSLCTTLHKCEIFQNSLEYDMEKIMQVVFLYETFYAYTEKTKSCIFKNYVYIIILTFKE